MFIKLYKTGKSDLFCLLLFLITIQPNIANNLDPYEALHNVESHLTSNLLDSHIMKVGMETMIFYANFVRKNI